MKKNKQFFVYVGVYISLAHFFILIASEADDASSFQERFKDAYVNLRSMGWKEFLRRNGWPYPWLCLPCLPCVLCAKKGQERDVRQCLRDINSYQTDCSS